MRNLSMLIILTLFTINCATIFGGSSYNYNIDSTPTGAKVTILKDGSAIGETVTPAVYKISMKGHHIVKFELKGYEETTVSLNKSLNYWILGNILLGGVLGIVVDSLTGAIDKPAGGNTTINVTLEKSSGKKAGIEGDSLYYARLIVSNQKEGTKTALIPLKKGNGTCHLEFTDYLIQ